MLSPFRPALVEHEGVRFFVRPTQEADRSEYQRVLETQRSPMRRRRGIDLDEFFPDFDSFNTGRSLNVGAFDSDGKMRSCYGMFFWSAMPYVTDNVLIVDRSHSPRFSPLKSGLVHTLRKLYEHCEEMGYFHHYSVRYAKHLDLEMRQWDKHTKEFFDRYERYDAEYVPAGQKAKWDAYWRVMGERTYPYDVVIRYTRLMMEHRKDVPVC